jgi:Arabinofuranosyltransferase N terminal
MTTDVLTPEKARVAAGPVWWRRPALWAPLLWAASLPVVFTLPKAMAINPFHLRGAMMPIAGGAVLMAGVLALTRWWRTETISGVAAGLFAGWIALTMRTALNGTPYGFEGLIGDSERMSAMATRYTVVWHSSDGIVGSVPSEYPPLYPWLIGRASVIVGIPAWKLVGVAEILTVSAAVVAGYLLWHRLLPGAVALAVTLAGFATYDLPPKAFEVIALVVFTPWAIATFAPVERGRLHWLPAGLIGGLSILVYQGYLMFGALGVLAMIVITWRAAADRRGYVVHLLATAAVAVVVSSWYLVPYLWTAATTGLQMTDTWQDSGIADSPLPFLAMTPPAVLQAVGLLGLLWYREKQWWATPLILLTVSCYVYHFVFLIGFILDGHTKVLQYTDKLTGSLLAIAGVLTVVCATPGLLRRLRTTPPAGLTGLAASVLAAWVGVTAWQSWMPGSPLDGTVHRPAVSTTYNGGTAAAYQPLPDGSYPKYAPLQGRPTPFPADQIAAEVETVRGPGLPLTLSTSETLFSFKPWPGYVAVDVSAAGATTDWFSRVAALHRLARVADPAGFAAAHTSYGRIDVFLLHDEGTHWTWAAADSLEKVNFSPAQFAASDFVVFRGLAGGLVLVVRR